MWYVPHFVTRTLVWILLCLVGWHVHFFHQTIKWIHDSRGWNPNSSWSFTSMGWPWGRNRWLGHPIYHQGQSTLMVITDLQNYQLTKVNNSEIFLVFSECIAGYFLNNGICEVCPVNSIKPTPGNDSNCSPCDGTSAVSNDEHTACGMLIFKNKSAALFRPLAEVLLNWM